MNPTTSGKRFVAKCGHGCLLLILVLISIELTSRIEDRLRYGVPFLANPDFDRDLFMATNDGERQGKPHGRYRKFAMNQFGFRGPPIEPVQGTDTIQVLLMGASETFGMLESNDRDYPARLRQLLRTQGNFQVINTALPGLSAETAEGKLDEWLQMFAPNIVVIYFSPLFELNHDPEKTSSESASVSSPSSLGASSPTLIRESSLNQQPSTNWELRLVDRLKDAIDKPDFLQRRIDRKVIATKRAEIGPLAVLQDVPDKIVERYLSHIQHLVDKIRDSGAIPILMTHAIRSNSPPSDSDRRTLESFLKNTPRATPEILLEYEAAVRRRLLEFGKCKGVRVLDLAAELNGCENCFGDLVHFTDEGAERVAKLLAAKLDREIHLGEKTQKSHLPTLQME